MMMSEAGKGDTPRPMLVDRRVFEQNWESVFCNKTKRQSEHTEPDKEKVRHDKTKDTV
jgi:hypothetical protein